MEKDKPNIALALEAARATGMRLDEFSSLRRAEVEAALRTGVLHLTHPPEVPALKRVKPCFWHWKKGEC